MKRQRRERRESAWTVAALMRQKRLPKLEALIEDEAKPKPQTWHEMKAAMQTFKGNHVEGRR